VSIGLASLAAKSAAKSPRGRLTILIAAAAMLAALPAAAQQNSTGSRQTFGEQPQSMADSESLDYNGLDYTRPQRNAELRLQYRTSSSPTTETDRDVAYLKLATKIQLANGWNLGLQGQLPFVDKTTHTLNTQNVDREAGIGDSFAQVVLARNIDPHWAYGFGARLVSPTAADALGSGKWQIMPGFGVRYSFVEIGPETYFVPSIRYAMSFAGDPTRRNINQPQIAPTLNIGLPDHWFVTFYPSNDIRINYGDAVPGQTGRLFLPFDAAVGRKLTEAVTLTLEVSVPLIKDYPVYNFKSELRISAKF
jgi:outer membrane putative beta-barrel porin/alpha-amylase